MPRTVTHQQPVHCSCMYRNASNSHTSSACTLLSVNQHSRQVCVSSLLFSLSERVGLTSPSTHYRSFQRRVFPITRTGTRTTKRQNTQIPQNKTMQKGTLFKSTTDTLKKPRLRDRSDRAWFSRIVQHLTRKWSRSILTTPEPTRGVIFTG